MTNRSLGEIVRRQYEMQCAASVSIQPTTEDLVADNDAGIDLEAPDLAAHVARPILLQEDRIHVAVRQPQQPLSGDVDPGGGLWRRGDGRHPDRPAVPAGESAFERRQYPK